MLKTSHIPLLALTVIFAMSGAPAHAGGNLRSFGSNSDGQLGIGSSWIEATEPAATDAVYAATGVGTVFYIDTDGTTWAAGDNRYGQLGIGLHRDTNLEFTPVEGDYSEIFTGHRGTYFLKKNGELHYAGFAGRYFLGGVRGPYAAPIPILTNVKRVDAHGSSVAFVFNDGSVRIMAQSFTNRFGFRYSNAPRPPMDKPVLVAEGAKDALLAFNNVVLLRDDGTLAGIGPAYADSDEDGLVEPTVIDTNVVAISRYGSSSFSYLKTDGSAHFWFSPDIALPMAVAGAESILGSSYIAENGAQWQVNFQETAEAQGDNPENWTSLHMEENETVQFVSTNTGVNAILRESGELFIDGNSEVVTGPQPEIGSRAPHSVDTDVQQVIATGGLHATTYYVKDDGSLWAVGSNRFQKTGVPGPSRYESPVLVMQNVSEVTASFGSAFAIDNAGVLWGMGLVLGYSFLSQDPEVLSAKTPAVLADGVAAVSAHDFTTAYVKDDRTLWLLGSNEPIASPFDEYQEFEDPLEIADDAIGLANTGSALFWIDQDNTLWGLGLHDAYYPDDNDGQPRKIAEDIDQVIGVEGQEAAFFITSSNELWSYGSQIFAPDDVTVPVLVDSNVTRASIPGIHFRNEVYYQKLDGTLWYMGYRLPNSPFGSPADEHPDAGVPAQIFVGEEVLGFARSFTNFMIITADNDAPSFIEQAQDSVIELGESATLAVETDGGYSGYTWYAGEPGDRSHPLRRAGISTLTVFPYATTSYWVEAYNANGTAVSESATVTVSNGLAGCYGDWAEWWSLPTSMASPGSNLDQDLYTNFQEYVLDLDPFTKQNLPIGIELDPSSSTFYLSRRPNPQASDSLIYSTSEDLANWTDLPSGEPNSGDAREFGPPIPVPPQQSGDAIFIQYRIEPSQ